MNLFKLVKFFRTQIPTQGTPKLSPLRILVQASLQSPDISSSLFLLALSSCSFFCLLSDFFFLPHLLFNLEPKFEEEIGNCLARWYPIPPRISMRSSSLQQNFLQSLNMWINCFRPNPNLQRKPEPAWFRLAQVRPYVWFQRYMNVLNVDEHELLWNNSIWSRFAFCINGNATELKRRNAGK